jgi:glutamate 5-kinase
MLAIENMAQTGRRIEVRKIVVKLGSAVVMGPGGDRVDLPVLEGLADAIVSLRASKVDVIVVTSGAIGVGCRLQSRPRPRSLPEKQALAAIGQISLMHTYQTVLAGRGLSCAQLLLTRGDMDDRRRYLNARYAMERILELGAVPIINENDATATQEISFGDNDGLSAYVAVKMKADLLLLLSSVDAVYGPKPGEADTNGTPGALAPIPVIRKVDAGIFGLAGKLKGHLAPGGYSTGGMRTKIEAAKMAMEAGVHAVIAGGKTPGIVTRVMSGSFTGTYFPARSDASISAKERWIGFGRAVRGNRILLDRGAVEAIEKKKRSLLPVGVVGVEGAFKPGDVVEICTRRGRVIARGLSNYSSDDVLKLMGRKSSEIEAVLGRRDYDEIVHRNNLALL